MSRIDLRDAIDFSKRVARRYLGNADAEDIAQDALLKALNRVDDRDYRPLLKTIIKNKAFDLKKVEMRRRAILASQFFEGSTGNLLETFLAAKAAQDALAKSPYGKVFWMRYEGASEQEVAAELGISQAAVRMQYYRARQAALQVLG